ncbi:MAG: hypothetical protein E7604_11430 [Ruminococcaceae bacterium]|nr:hypothetical protein [Oscillospiraceae bacterium]
MTPSAIKRTVIFGTDWWTDCDDCAALRMVCRYTKAGVWQFAGVILNAAAPYAAASIRAVLADEGFANVPLGIDLAADDYGGNPPYQYAVAAAAGMIGIRNEDCENSIVLYRRLLADAADGTAELLEVGYLPSLASLLSSPPDSISPLSGAELVRHKVHHVWCMGGNWKNDGVGRENNFCRNVRARVAAAEVLAACPVSMTFLGYEIGENVYAHPPQNPDDLIRIAFDAHGSPDGRCAWDPLLIHLAASGDPASAGYTTISGHASVDALSGENRFVPVSGGLHRYVRKCRDNAWYEAQIDALL